MDQARRRVLALGSGAMAGAALVGRGAFAAQAVASQSDDPIAGFTGGAAIADGGVDLAIDAFVEDGHYVPVSVAAKGAAAIGLYALENPNPELAVFTFGPLAGSRSVSTRIRLARSQDVIAVARMEDGSFRRAVVPVAVAIGGCNV